MTIRRNGEPKDTKPDIPQFSDVTSVPKPEQDTNAFNNVQQQDEVLAKQAAQIDAVAEEVNRQVLKAQQDLRSKPDDNAMSAIPIEEYSGPHPGVHVTPSTDSKAYQGPLTQRQREDLIQRLQARTATEADMALIDESMIFDLPFIKASDFSIPGQYDPRPIDPTIRFRWVNYVNALQSNMQRFLALGFVLTTPADVDQVKTPLADTMINGTQIKQYDVVLMKINVLKLMALYKHNMMVSANKLDMIREGGKALAQQSFNDLLNSGDRAGLNQVRVASQREPVWFSQS